MEKFIGCALGVIIFLALEALIAWGFQVLWNWLMPFLFHLPTLTYGQAFGVMCLLSFVGSFFRSSSTSKTK